MWQTIIDIITKIDGTLNGIVWGWPAIIMILGAGLILTIRTKFLQITHFAESWKETIIPTVKSIGKKRGPSEKGSVSQFEAFSAAISGTVGTGNIIGVVSAILTGGPGAVFWMWISAFFGMVTNYSENVLGLYYRKKNAKGEFSGGAFYYIYYGMKWKWLAYVAAVFCMVAAVGMSGVQTNKISGTITSAISDNPSTVMKILIGLIVAIIVAFIIIGGIKRIGRVASMLVPFMSVLFMILAVIGIIMHAGRIPSAIAAIFTSAFSFKAAGSGIFGYVFAQTIRKGMARGVFSNEAGLGSSVIAHSASETREPVKQGLWGVFEVFYDTFVICTLTALMFLTTNDMYALTGTESDSAMAMGMFSQNYSTFGTVLFCVILPLFALTTILAWSYYGEKAVEFCFRGFGAKAVDISVLVFKIAYVVLIVASAVISSDLVWSIDDTCNGLMAIPNLVCLIVLNKQLGEITKNYFARKKGAQIEPMLSAYPEQNEEFKRDLMNQK